MPRSLAEYVRTQSFMQRTTKTNLVLQALDAFYESPDGAEYADERPYEAFVFLRMLPPDSDRLEGYAAEHGIAMREVVRQAIAHDMKRKGVSA